MKSLPIEKTAALTQSNEFWIGNSPMIELTKHRLQSMANSTLPVLIYGETGTGKLIAARMLHNHDKGEHHPFIEICCRQKEDLEKTKQTGHPLEQKEGHPSYRSSEGEDAHLLERHPLEEEHLLHRIQNGLNNAQGGSLFIRGIESLTDSEASLLHAFLLQSGAIESQQVRLIMSSRIKPATSELIKVEHHFIDWLHHRCLSIELPKLAHRVEDIESLVLDYQQQDLIASNLQFQPSAWRLLKCYAWPENVKQLTHCLDTLAVQTSSATISESELLDCFPDMADSTKSNISKSSVGSNVSVYVKPSVRESDHEERVHQYAKMDSATEKSTFIKLPDTGKLEGKNALGISATVARHPALDKAVVYLYNNFRKPIHMEELAAQACVSPSHLSYLFKHYLGSSFKQTLLLLRIVEAMKLLVENPTRQVTQVCDDVGFSDLSFFVRKFKSIVGMSPGVYRDQYGRMKASRELLVVEEVLTMPMLQSLARH